MDTIYDELWENHTLALNDFIIKVPQPPCDLEPGCGLSIQQAIAGEFLASGLTERVREKAFKVLRAGTTLPCGDTNLLVRAEYEHIERLLVHAEVQQRSVARSREPASSLHFSVHGHPGSGKSAFLCYLLVRRLIKGLPTVYREGDSFCFLFDRNSPGTRVNAATLFDLRKDRQHEFWVLTDEPITDPRWRRLWSNGFIVSAPSPESARVSKPWSPGRNSGVHYMSNWRWEEIFAAFCLNNGRPPTRAQILMLYTTFVCLGPVARTCLDSIRPITNSGYHRSLKSYLGDLDGEIGTFLEQNAYIYERNTFGQPFSHRIVIMEPTEDRSSYRNGIATRWLAHRVLHTALEHSANISLNLYKWFSLDRLLKNEASWTFEGFAQFWLERRGPFTAERLPVTDSRSAPLHFRTRHILARAAYFKSPEDLAQQTQKQGGYGIAAAAIGKYFQPTHRRAMSVDGLVFTHPNALILLRITQSHQLTIDQNEVKDLLRSLPATISNIHIIFVVPKASAQSHSQGSRILDTSTLRTRGAHFTIRQFRLSLSEEDMLSVPNYEAFSSDEE